MRILLLSDRLPPEHTGGAENMAWALATGLHRAGHVVTALAGTSRAFTDETLDGVTIRRLPTHVLPSLQSWATLYNPQVVGAARAFAKTVRPDVVHAHNIHNHLSFGTLAAIQRLGIPTVFTAHDYMTFTYGKLLYDTDAMSCEPPTPERYRLPVLYNLRLMRTRYNPLRMPVIRHILRQARARTCLSNAHRTILEANLRLPFHVIYNGIVPSAWQASEATISRLRARWNLADRRVVVFSGRFTTEKGGRALLTAMTRVVEDVPNAVVLLLSNIQLEQIADHSDPRLRSLLNHHVVVAGWLGGEELAAAYHLADVVAAPSLYPDPVPTVVQQAMAAGKPVVGTCLGGTPEIVLDGETGYVVNPSNSEALAEALRRVLCNPDLQRRLGAAGARRVAQHFAMEGHVARMVDVYRRVVG
jgi:glycosyltransferase involved in cell wall biosynthesis